VKVRPAKSRAAPAWMPMEGLVSLLASVDVLETLPPRAAGVRLARLLGPLEGARDHGGEPLGARTENDAAIGGAGAALLARPASSATLTIWAVPTPPNAITAATKGGTITQCLTIASFEQSDCNHYG
jgi:hypothetical protein